MKELILVGGPNGAGKTTFVESFLRREGATYLGADLIAYELCPEDVQSVAVAAGREFLRRLQDCRERGESVIVESTLAGKGLAKHIEKYRDDGYTIKVIFITLPDAATSAKRVRLRVSKGGHDVPPADIRRRFLRTHRNFWELYRLLAVRWYLYSNKNGKHQLVAGGEENNYDITDQSGMGEFLWKLKK